MEKKFRSWVPKRNVINYDPIVSNVFDGDETCKISLNIAIICHKNPLMIFTGLYDKNAAEIYEGDIFEYIEHGRNHLKSFRAFVVFDSHYACFGYKKSTRDFLTHFNKERELYANFLNHCEVIGNIYETPSLLEVPS